MESLLVYHDEVLETKPKLPALVPPNHAPPFTRRSTNQCMETLTDDIHNNN